MSNIIIYTTPRKIASKQGKLKDDPDYSESGDYYWAFTHFPKEVEEVIEFILLQRDLLEDILLSKR